MVAARVAISEREGGSERWYCDSCLVRSGEPEGLTEKEALDRQSLVESDRDLPAKLRVPTKRPPA